MMWCHTKNTFKQKIFESAEMLILITGTDQDKNKLFHEREKNDQASQL